MRARAGQSTAHIKNAATTLFSIPELLELILLSLPTETIHLEIATLRTILTNRTISLTWHNLLLNSPSLRRRLYLPPPKTPPPPSPLSLGPNPPTPSPWSLKSRFPPSTPNPWIPHLLLHQRSWGSAWPFETASTTSFIGTAIPSKPRHWTFTLEISRAQWSRFPSPGPWREMLATVPPFAEMWFTRSSYELGSGRAPFVTYLDFEPGKTKREQEIFVGRREGVRLGDLVDVVGRLFEAFPDAKFVMVESVRPVGVGVDEEVGVEERPRERGFVPGMSAERSVGWYE